MRLESALGTCEANFEKGMTPEDRRDTYFIGCYQNEKLRAIKIGTVARGMAVQRLRTLQTGSVDQLKLLAVYQGNVERKLHRLFAKSRLRPNSEFFRPTKPFLELIHQLQQISRDLIELDTIHSGRKAA